MFTHEIFIGKSGGRRKANTQINRQYSHGCLQERYGEELRFGAEARAGLGSGTGN